MFNREKTQSGRNWIFKGFLYGAAIGVVFGFLTQATWKIYPFPAQMSAALWGLVGGGLGLLGGFAIKFLHQMIKSRTLPPISGTNTPIPWPLPLPPEMQTLTFRGEGNNTTEEFTLQADAALRIIVENGPFTLRVRKADGTFLSDVARVADKGLALMAIPERGRYSLVIDSSSRWGVTVVYQR